MSKILSYRGKMAKDTQEKITLHTLKGKIGYRIKRFEILAENPGTVTSEPAMKIYSKEQSAVTGTFDFTESDLLAAAYTENQHQSTYLGLPKIIVFDNTVFNQDIYVTYTNLDGTDPCNYHIELETVDLSDLQSTQLTLKNLRAIASR
jgi:hypothetical protein